MVAVDLSADIVSEGFYRRAPKQLFGRRGGSEAASLFNHTKAGGVGSRSATSVLAVPQQCFVWRVSPPPLPAKGVVIG